MSKHGLIIIIINILITSLAFLCILKPIYLNVVDVKNKLKHLPEKKITLDHADNMAVIIDAAQKNKLIIQSINSDSSGQVSLSAITDFPSMLNFFYLIEQAGLATLFEVIDWHVEKRSQLSVKMQFYLEQQSSTLIKNIFLKNKIIHNPFISVQDKVFTLVDAEL